MYVVIALKVTTLSRNTESQAPAGADYVRDAKNFKVRANAR